MYKLLMFFNLIPQFFFCLWIFRHLICLDADIRIVELFVQIQIQIILFFSE